MFCKFCHEIMSLSPQGKSYYCRRCGATLRLVWKEKELEEVKNNESDESTR